MARKIYILGLSSCYVCATINLMLKSFPEILSNFHYVEITETNFQSFLVRNKSKISTLTLSIPMVFFYENKRKVLLNAQQVYKLMLAKVKDYEDSRVKVKNEIMHTFSTSVTPQQKTLALYSDVFKDL